MPEKTPIIAKAILEMLGAPKEYIEKTLKDYVAKLKTDGLKIRKERYEPAEQREKLYSTFVEIEAEFPRMGDLISFCFDSLPSSIDIMSPDTLTLETGEIALFLNDLQARLHQADMMIKTHRAQHDMLDRSATNVFNNFLLHLVHDGPKNADDLARTVGVREDQLKPFLDKLVENKRITEQDGTYSVA